MKKILLLMGGALLGSATIAQAETPEKIAGAMLSRISANGEWAVSCGDGSFSVYNLKTGDIYTAEVDEDDYNAFYEAGYGNPVSDNGIVVGSTTYTGGAAYWHITDDAPEGEWVLLPVLDESTSCAHGITPDGSRIVGTSARPGVSYGDDAVHSVPLLWQRNAEGTYDMVELPYPTVDFTGKRVPQYIITHAISEDGTKIFGQVTDYAGFMHTQIVYNEQADGSWTYEYLHPELQTLGYTFPDWEPYTGPSYPQQTDFMSDDEKEAYDDACDAWDYYSGDSYPVVTDFMTEEEIAAYNAAMAEYKEAHEAWEEIDDAFTDVYWQVYDEGAPDFLMNTLAMSSNGQYAVASKGEGDYWSGYTYTPYLFNLATGEYTIYATESDDETSGDDTTTGDDDDDYLDDDFGVGSTSSNTLSICANAVSNNGDILGATTCLDGYLRLSWIKPANGEEFVRLHDYMATVDADAAEWMEIYLPGDVIVGVDDDTYEYEYAEELLDGLPVCDANMKTIVSWVYNMFAEDYDDYQYSLVFRLPETSGIQSVAAATDKSFSVKASRNGEITINGDAKLLEVFDLTGKSVYKNNAPTATVNTNLNAGIYLVKATATNGKTAIVKAAFTE